MKLEPSYIYKYVKVVSDGKVRFGRVCDIGYDDEDEKTIELQLSYGFSIYVYKEDEIDTIEVIDDRYIKEFDDVILKDGRTATVVDYMGPDLIVETGSNAKDYDTEVISRNFVVEVIKE